MDEMMEEERRRWQKAWDEQVSIYRCFKSGVSNDNKLGHHDEHMDKKIELVSRGFNSKSTSMHAIITRFAHKLPSLRRS